MEVETLPSPRLQEQPLPEGHEPRPMVVDPPTVPNPVFGGPPVVLQPGVDHASQQHIELQQGLRMQSDAVAATAAMSVQVSRHMHGADQQLADAALALQEERHQRALESQAHANDMKQMQLKLEHERALREQAEQMHD